MKTANKIVIIGIVIFAILIIMIACSTYPTKQEMIWSQNNISKIRKGMAPEQIISIFGYPDKQSTDSYGRLTSYPWEGLRYVYEFWKKPWKDEFCINTFTFALVPDPKLYYWEINCAY